MTNWVRTRYASPSADKGVCLKPEKVSATIGRACFISSDYYANTKLRPTVTICYNVGSGAANGLVSGQLYYLRNVKSDKYLDVPYSNGADGTDLIQHAFNGNRNQQFKLIYNATTNDYSLSPECASGSAIEITNASSSNNAIVQIWSKPASGPMDSQRFNILSNANGSYRLLSYTSAYTKAVVVEQASLDDNAAIIQYSDNGSTNGHWVFERVETTQCSRAVQSFPYSSDYTRDVAASESRYNQMPAVERATKETTLRLLALNLQEKVLPFAVAYPLATRCLLHFLSNTGTLLTVDERYIKEASGIADTISKMTQTLNESYSALRVNNWAITYASKTSMQYDAAGRGLSEDWDYAINKCELWGKVNATGTTSGKITICVADYYDWEAGNMGGLLDTAADLFNQMHYVGVARDFPVYGEATF